MSMQELPRKADRAATPDATPNGNGAGRPGDLPAAFVEALVSAARREEEPGPEAQVAAAIGLGWYLGALAHPGATVDTAAAARGDLTAITALTDGHVLDFCRRQVEVATAKLTALVERSGLSLPELDALNACIDSAQDDARRAAANTVDHKALAVLSAADSRLGKAYGAGRALMDLTTRPGPDAPLHAHVTAARVAPIVAAVDDLASALPPHAGHSVRASLLEWQRAVAGQSPVAAEERETWLQLARQGELWRALLAGEKLGTDMLEIDDYIDAADRLSKRARRMGLRLLRRFPDVALAVVALFAGGVALVVATDSAAAIVAGAGTILASLGLTWRGLGRSAAGLAGKLERPLWGAELDVAITQAITLLEREQGRDVARERRAVAVALGRRGADGASGTTRADA